MRQLTQLLSGVFLLLVFAASVTFTYYNSIPVTIGIGLMAVTTAARVDLDNRRVCVRRIIGITAWIRTV